jgi:hypothetical protein
MTPVMIGIGSYVVLMLALALVIVAGLSLAAWLTGPLPRYLRRSLRVTRSRPRSSPEPLQAGRMS